MFPLIEVNVTHGFFPLEEDSDGKLQHIEAFNKKHQQLKEYFDKVVSPVNNRIKSSNWAIRFTEHPSEEKKFVTDIYAENKDKYCAIASVIKKMFTENEFQFFYKGGTSTYTRNR